MIELLPYGTKEQEEYALYINVSNMFNRPMLIYFIFNILGILIYTLDLIFKGEKGCFRYVKLSMVFWPFIISFIIIWILWLKTSFEGVVCTCGYKPYVANKLQYEERNHITINEDFSSNANEMFLNGHPTINDYLCDNKLNNLITIVLCVEMSLTLLHFIVVIFHYYYNLLVIKWRPVGYIDSQLDEIEFKEQR